MAGLMNYRLMELACGVNGKLNVFNNSKGGTINFGDCHFHNTSTRGDKKQSKPAPVRQQRQKTTTHETSAQAAIRQFHEKHPGVSLSIDGHRRLVMLI